MKLQINLSGAWRDVMPPYSPENDEYVRYYAASLHRLADKHSRLRTIDPAGNVTAYFDPDKGWRTPGKEAS